MRAPMVLAGVALLTGGCVAAPAGFPAPSDGPAGVAPSLAGVTASAAPSAAPTPWATPVAVPSPTRAPTPVPLPACARPSLTLGTIDLRRLCPEGVDLRIDALLGDADAAAIAAQVTDDLAAVRREFRWTLRSPAVVDVFATRDRYAAGLRAAFGYGAATSEFVADNSVAFFEPSLRRIAVNWEAVRDRRPIAALRHELTHVVTLEACAPRCDLVPAWLNEGQARLAEARMPGGEWRLMRVRYEAASMAATATLLPLGALVTQLQWNSLTDWIGYYKYQQAARATELLREDVGDDAIARLYARIRAGEDVARAYAALAGRPFEAFASDLERRMLAVAPAAPGIATAPQSAAGDLGFLLWGFAPETKVTLRVRSRALDEQEEVTVSPQGAFFGSIDRTYPPGTYTITASAGPVRLAAVVAKTGGRPIRGASAD